MEIGGKDLILKKQKDLTVDIAVGTADDPTAILMTAHGLSVGDVVFWPTVPVGVTEVTADTPYYVVAVPSSGAFKISATPGGSAITFTDTVTDHAVEGYYTVGGLRSSSFSFSSEAVDGTWHGSNQWKKNIDGAGIRAMSLSGEGVWTDETSFDEVEEAALANTNVDLIWADVKAGKVYKGLFKITAIEGAGPYDGEGTFSMSAESSGPVSVYKAA